MAQYTILTTPEQEEALAYSFGNSTVEEQTQEQFLQDKVNHTVFNPMIADQANAKSIALSASLLTIPPANEEKAKQEIAAVIVANGGTLIPAGPPPDPLRDTPNVSSVPVITQPPSGNN